MRSYWGIVPAAGKGERLGAPLPKQYTVIQGKTILEYTLATLLQQPWMGRVVVALAKEDPFFATLPVSRDPRIVVVEGGATRMESVGKALEWISTVADISQDWVLTHDAARPAVDPRDIAHLITALENDEVGGLLGVPVKDTMKYVSSVSRVTQTVPRDGLWHALTPQLFRLSILKEAMQQAIESGMFFTDESGVVEYKGYASKMVKSQYPHKSGKLTVPEDMAYFSWLLQQ